LALGYFGRVLSVWPGVLLATMAYGWLHR
jgi:hypothetical protein